MQVGTATFWNPRAPLEIAEELGDFLKKEKVGRVSQLVNTLK